MKLSSAPPKRKGEYAESLFLARAIARGFNVCKPWGDSARFDFILEKPGRRPLRVQVKSAWKKQRGARYYNVNVAYYVVSAGTNRVGRYTARETDFLVAWVEPEDAWYVIPLEAVRNKSVMLYPAHDTRRGKPRYERFREAWELLG